MPTVADWAAYVRVRDAIGDVSDYRRMGDRAWGAEVGQVLELTDKGIRNRYGLIQIDTEEV